MRALVTGPTGFVGSHLVAALVRRQDEITVLVRSPAKAAPLRELAVTIVEGDLDDTAALEAASQDREIVYHVAGAIRARHEKEFLRINREGTHNLVRVLERVDSPRLIYVSSLAAGGPAEPGTPQSGTEPPRPLTAYGRSKLAAELSVKASKLAWTILRPPLVYGPRDRELLRVFKLVDRGVAPVLGSHRQELSAVFGPDLAAALVAAGHEACIGRTYCPCHPERFSSLELAREMGRALGRDLRPVRVPSWLVKVALTLIGATTRLAGRATVLNRDKANELLAPAWTGDPTPLTRDSGWKATTDLRTGLAETAVWYRRTGWL